MIVSAPLAAASGLKASRTLKKAEGKSSTVLGASQTETQLGIALMPSIQSDSGAGIMAASPANANKAPTSSFADQYNKFKQSLNI